MKDGICVSFLMIKNVNADEWAEYVDFMWVPTWQPFCGSLFNGRSGLIKKDYSN